MRRAFWSTLPELVCIVEPFVWSSIHWKHFVSKWQSAEWKWIIYRWKLNHEWYNRSDMIGTAMGAVPEVPRSTRTCFTLFIRICFSCNIFQMYHQMYPEVLEHVSPGELLCNVGLASGGQTHHHNDLQPKSKIDTGGHFVRILGLSFQCHAGKQPTMAWEKTNIETKIIDTT